MNNKWVDLLTSRKERREFFSKDKVDVLKFAETTRTLPVLQVRVGFGGPSQTTIVLEEKDINWTEIGGVSYPEVKGSKLVSREGVIIGLAVVSPEGAEIFSRLWNLDNPANPGQLVKYWRSLLPAAQTGTRAAGLSGPSYVENQKTLLIRELMGLVFLTEPNQIALASAVATDAALSMMGVFFPVKYEGGDSLETLLAPGSLARVRKHNARVALELAQSYLNSLAATVETYLKTRVTFPFQQTADLVNKLIPTILGQAEKAEESSPSARQLMITAIRPTEGSALGQLAEIGVGYTPNPVLRLIRYESGSVTPDKFARYLNVYRMILDIDQRVENHLLLVRTQGVGVEGVEETLQTVRLPRMGEATWKACLAWLDAIRASKDYTSRYFPEWLRKEIDELYNKLNSPELKSTVLPGVVMEDQELYARVTADLSYVMAEANAQELADTQGLI